MLVILTEQQVISTEKVCGGCLMADSGGGPRWRQGKLCCGHLIEKPKDNLPNVYECQMGFHVTNIK